MSRKLRNFTIKIPGYIGVWYVLMTIYDLLFQISGIPFRSGNYVFYMTIQEYASIMAILISFLNIALIYSVTEWGWRNTSVIAAVITGLIFISPSHTFFTEFIIFMIAYIILSGIKNETESPRADWFLSKIGYETSSTAGDLSEQDRVENIKEKYVKGEIGDEELSRKMNTALDDGGEVLTNKQERRKLEQKEQE